MGEKLVVGPVDGGLRNDREPFNIDNDSFPALINAYQWRGRIKRKRGTAKLGRLQRFFTSGTTFITLDVDGVGNLITGFSLQSNGSIVPGSVALSGGMAYTDPTEDGYLTPTGTGGPNTIDYSSGTITIPGEALGNISASFIYYPDLPVMGLCDLILDSTDTGGTIGFDTVYAYNIDTIEPYTITSVSFYKNPPANVLLPFYTPKTDLTPVVWNGETYQQFWTTNYENAFWATNGIDIPFTGANVGMQYRDIDNIIIFAGPPFPPGPPVTLIITIPTHGLVIGDFVFLNEVVGLTGANYQTGYVTFVIDPNNIAVTFPNASIAGAYVSDGILQYLTNTAVSGVDCIRWYDGNPADGSGLGWVNFMPPLSENPFSIANLPADVYYLAGARMIVPFKDRLLFIGPVVQSSSRAPAYLRDTVIYSQNGTPYYNCSYINTPSSVIDTPTSASNDFLPVLVPTNQTATSTSFFEDQTGFGGFVSAGTQQAITTVGTNEDSLIIGFNNSLQTRFIFSGSDIIPFNFFIINSEMGSLSTFSSVDMDQGVMTRGTRGFILTSQTTCARVDLQIPDQVFEINNLNNGAERFCSQRDFVNEWIYFTYSSNDSGNIYPDQTLQFNYRDNSWAIFNETYTTYGLFKRTTGYTWENIGNEFSSWAEWNESWGSGSTTILQPQVIAGNQQGFVIFRDEGTGESPSLWIKSFSGSVITSPSHNLQNGDYIYITECLGTISWQVNRRVFLVSEVDTDVFTLNPEIDSGTYFGNGVITKLYIPFIQTKQFPTSWGIGRKTRIGVQQYLFSTTQDAQITLQIYLSQNSSSPYNAGPIVPNSFSVNNSLVFSDILFTCPESTNLGLTPANKNLQMLTAVQQQQTWHRMNTSLIGDTVQIGFTLSDTQMRSLTPNDVGTSITGASQASECVLLCTGNFQVGLLILITGVVGMQQLNGNYYLVIDSDATTITIGVDSTGFNEYVSGGLATPVNIDYQIAEIELHGFILDISPSFLLA